MTALYAGCPIIFNPDNDYELFMDQLRQQKIQSLFTRGKRLVPLLQNTLTPQDPNSSALSTIISPHAGLTHEQVLETKEKTGIRIIPGYYCPEATCYATFVSPHLNQDVYTSLYKNKKELCIGSPLHPNELDIQNSGGIAKRRRYG